MVSEPIQQLTKESKLKFWKNLISELKNSNLAIDKFCQKYAINSSTHYKWKNIIQGHPKKARVSKKKISQDQLTSNFIEIPIKSQNHSFADELTIIFPNGLKVVFNQKIEPSKLIQILKELSL